MKLSKIFLVLCVTIFYAGSAQALTVYDPKNHTENLASKLEAIKQTTHQAEMVQHQLTNLVKLKPGYQDETLAEIRSCVNSINAIRKSVNAIGTDFDEMMEAFDEISPDYEDWNGASAARYSRQMKKVRQAWDDALKQSVFSQSEAGPDKHEDTSEKVQSLLTASQDADGNLAVVQTLAQLNALQISELQKMNAITSDALRTQAMYQKYQLEAEKAGEKRREEMYENYKDNYESGVKITSSGKGLHHFSK